MSAEKLLSTQMAYEQSLQHIALQSTDALRLSFDGDAFQFTYKGISGRRRLDRAIMHQISSRVFGQDLEFGQAINLMNSELHNNRTEFTEVVRKKLVESNAIMLLDPKQQSVYGIVSPTFETIDAKAFRDRFMQSFSRHGEAQKEPKTFGRNAFGEVYESFNLRNDPGKTSVGEPIEYRLIVIYGLNNGYSAYRIALDRMVLVCKNGMTRKERGLARLKHSRNPDVSRFIDDIMKNIGDVNQQLQQNIEAAKNRELEKAKVEELYNRVHVAQVVKDRVWEQLDKEIVKTGNTEWSLSQAFTNIGTHFYGASYDKHHEGILQGIGSQVVDNNLNQLLLQNVDRITYGDLVTYGALLPKGAQRN